MTDKLHFDDLTKITCPIGFLDDDTFMRLTEHNRTHSVQVWGADGWATIRKAWLCAHAVCRAAPLTMPVYPWAALHERFKFCAVDGDGEAYAFEKCPARREPVWMGRGDVHRIDGVFSGYKPGTVDSRDSLQARPEE